MLTDKEKAKFYKFMKVIGLCPKGQSLIDLDPVQDTHGIMSASILCSTKELKKILEKTLHQKAKKKETKFNDTFSFKIKDKGWIVVEKYSQDAYLTLINKWW